MLGSARSKRSKRCEDENAVGCNDQGRLAGNGLARADLCLTDAEEVFFFPVVDFDLPAIEIGLKSPGGIEPRTGADQERRLPVKPASVLTVFVGCRRQSDQGDGSGLGAPLP